MKKMIAMILAAGAMSGFAAPTANEDFVIAEDAKTYTNAVQAAKEYIDTAIATAARPATRIVTEDGMRFTDATGCVFAVSFATGRFVATNLFLTAPGVEFVYTNISPIAWGLVGGSPFVQLNAKFIAYDATKKRWVALPMTWENYLTPENIAAVDAGIFQSATNTPFDAASFTIYDTGFIGVPDHAAGTFYYVAGSPVTSLVDRVVYESGTNAIISASTTYTDHATNNLHKSLALITTNDVCNIVTNEVVVEFTEWECPQGYKIVWKGNGWEPYYLGTNPNTDIEEWQSTGYAEIGSADSTNLIWEEGETAPIEITASRQAITRNALGLARLIDLPPLTNGIPEEIASKASINDVQLTPVYGGKGEEWSYSGLPSGVTVAYIKYDNEVSYWAWHVVLSNSDYAFVSADGDADATEVHVNSDQWLGSGDSNYDFTASRNPIIGYTLGTQTNKVMASTGSVAAASAAVAQAATNYTDTITNGLASASSVAAASAAATSYTDSAIAATDTSYPRVSGITNVNQTVQYVSIDSAVPTTLSIMLPTTGDTKDWIVYVTAQTNVTITLPAATWWLADTSATNDIAPRTPTALYFSQAADNIYTMGRQEFTEVVLP